MSGKDGSVKTNRNKQYIFFPYLHGSLTKVVEVPNQLERRRKYIALRQKDIRAQPIEGMAY